MNILLYARNITKYMVGCSHNKNYPSDGEKVPHTFRHCHDYLSIQNLRIQNFQGKD